MKKILLLHLLVVLLAACSTPKYTYNFDYYDYNSGRKAAAANAPVQSMPATITEPVFSASVEARVPNSLQESPAVSEAVEVSRESAKDSEDQVKQIKERYLAMDRAERKAFRKDVKHELKRMVREKKVNGTEGVSEVSAMDNDLKLAIIFGAVGLTLSLFSGINAAFWVLGVIAIVVGVVFLIRWLVRQ